MIRPYLRDLINEHRPIMELNNNTNNSNNNTTNNNCNSNTNNSSNNTNNSNNEENDRAECKIMQNNCISDKDFEDTRTIYSASRPVEIFTGSDTENAIDTLFNTILNRIQQAIKTLNEIGSGLTHESVALLYYYFSKTDIKIGESYIMSPDWIVSKKVTINPKNEKDNECFKWSIIAELNYNKVKEKELKKRKKFKRADTDFSSHQSDWEKFEQENTSIALNVLFVSHNSEEIKL